MDQDRTEFQDTRDQCQEPVKPRAVFRHTGSNTIASFLRTSKETGLLQELSKTPAPPQHLMEELAKKVGSFSVSHRNQSTPSLGGSEHSPQAPHQKKVPLLPPHMIPKAHSDNQLPRFESPEEQARLGSHLLKADHFEREATSEEQTHLDSQVNRFENPAKQSLSESQLPITDRFVSEELPEDLPEVEDYFEEEQGLNEEQVSQASSTSSSNTDISSADGESATLTPLESSPATKHAENDFPQPSAISDVPKKPPRKPLPPRPPPVGRSPSTSSTEDLRHDRSESVSAPVVVKPLVKPRSATVAVISSEARSELGASQEVLEPGLELHKEEPVVQELKYENEILKHQITHLKGQRSELVHENHTLREEISQLHTSGEHNLEPTYNETEVPVPEPMGVTQEDRSPSPSQEFSEISTTSPSIVPMSVPPVPLPSPSVVPTSVPPVPLPSPSVVPTSVPPVPLPSPSVVPTSVPPVPLPRSSPKPVPRRRSSATVSTTEQDKEGEVKAEQSPVPKPRLEGEVKAEQSPVPKPRLEGEVKAEQSPVSKPRLEGEVKAEQSPVSKPRLEGKVKAEQSPVPKPRQPPNPERILSVPDDSPPPKPPHRPRPVPRRTISVPGEVSTTGPTENLSFDSPTELDAAVFSSGNETVPEWNEAVDAASSVPAKTTPPPTKPTLPPAKPTPPPAKPTPPPARPTLPPAKPTLPPPRPGVAFKRVNLKTDESWIKRKKQDSESEESDASRSSTPLSAASDRPDISHTPYRSSPIIPKPSSAVSNYLPPRVTAPLTRQRTHVHSSSEVPVRRTMTPVGESTRKREVSNIARSNSDDNISGSVKRKTKEAPVHRELPPKKPPRAWLQKRVEDAHARPMSMVEGGQAVSYDVIEIG